MAAALEEETADVLARLIRFKTVNPPGGERECQEWIAAYLREAGLEVELLGAEPDRPNLVARLTGDEPGPVLGYLSHVDTVLADPDDWTHDPWSGAIDDGHLWGRGALDMKNQTAAEIVAAATLARSGWRPAKGELKVISVVDEEVGGRLGAQWLTERRPDVVHVDWLLNEGGGAVIPYGDRRLYPVGCAEKGTFRFTVRAHGVAAHASIPGYGDNALVKLAPVIARLGERTAPFDVVDEPRALLEALGEDPDDPQAAVDHVRAVEPRLAALLEPTLRVTAAPTRVSASEKINVIPARAELQVDGRMPPGMDGEATLRRVRDLVGDGLEIDVMEEVVGNRSAADTPLMDAIRGWVGENDPGAEAVPSVLHAFTDSRWFREAFPDCAAYGFFPMRHQNYYETWSLIHSSDERIDLRDLAFAASFFVDLPEEASVSPVPEDKLRLGGMALRNGLLVHGPTHWAASVRDRAGEIRTASGRKPRLRAVDPVPGLRGVVRLGEAFVVIPLVKRALPQAKLPYESPSVLGVAAAASLSGALLRRRVGGSVGEAAAAMLSLAPAVLALRGGELAAYHGVEHKAIAAYESPDDQDAADAAKEHDRCGSHLVTPLLASNLAGALLVRRVLEKPGPVAGAGVAVASTAAAVEIFAWCDRNAGTPLARALRRPGFELQRVLGTREPDERQLEVGRAALAEILRVEPSPSV